MHIEIATRLKPYSSSLGTYFVLPLSSFRIQVFPTCLYIDDISESLPKRKCFLDLSLEGPIDEFFVQQDLERYQIQVFGKSFSGHFRYTLKATESNDGIVFHLEKGSSLTLKSEGTFAKEICTLNPKESIIFGVGSKPIDTFIEIERLSLGSHKSQDVELIQRRKDFFQILPLWYRLGQLLPFPHNSIKYDHSNEDPLSYLSDLRNTFKNDNSEDKLLRLKKLFGVGFDFAFSPRITDSDHQGILDDNQLVVSGSPLDVLSSGFHLIRSLFIDIVDEKVQILPSLPSEFHSGRLLNAKIMIQDLKVGEIDLEWSKKEIRRVIFRAEKSIELKLDFCRKKQKCRLRTASKDKGLEYISGTELFTKAGTTYWLDNFQ